MKLVMCILLSIFLLSNGKVTAQNKKDTIYYLLDTASTPVKDRIISIEEEENERLIYINCHCMKGYEIPVFRFNSKYGISLKKDALKTLKLLSLVRLMENDKGS
jgi:hypothetical protein